MWSSWAWVRTIAWKRSPRLRTYVMSGIATSMPSMRSSGNMTPQSTAIAASWYSRTSRLRPISPRPPRGMTRSGAPAPDRLRGVAPVDDDVARAPERPSENGDAGQLHLGDPAELELRKRDDHRQDVQLAPVIRHEDVGSLRVERGEPPRSHPHPAD